MRGQPFRLLMGLWVAAALLAGVALGQRNKDDGSGPLELLEKKGLRKLSTHFALAGETEVGKALRAAESLKKRLTDSQREVNDREQKVEEKRKTIVDCLEKRQVLRAQLTTARTIESHNKIVLALNELGDRVNLLQTSTVEEEALKAAREAAAKVSEAYIEHLLHARKTYGKLMDQYEQLAADDEVSSAIKAFNKTSTKKYQLGPSPTLLASGRRLKNLEEMVLSESIAIRRGPDNLWYLTVMFNGKHAQEMAIDTGASLVVLPAKNASAAGLTPTSNSPTIRCQLADGSIVEARLVHASSVRVGKFSVENVECAIMPPDLQHASPLLGQSFFKNFSYKIDSERSKLVMSRIELPEKETGRGRGRK